MATIYSSDSNKTLGEFIRDVVDVNSNIVIPDLQRPYIWNPDQVILLIDSIFKKWPFGSLLCWNVKNYGSFIPHRPFWFEVVRDIKDKDSQMLSYNESASSYLMILDGQQRIQSLLLALGGDSWGFTLPDKEWKKVLEGSDDSIDPRYWSSGCLCLNIDDFQLEYKYAKKKIAGIEVGKCLKWAVTYENSGVSHKDKKQVLPVTNLNDGHYIRFSKLWNLAEPSITTQDDYIEILKKAFAEVSEDTLQLFIQPLAQFMQVISDVKESTVITQLTVKDFERSGINDRSIYNNAIVNIFARLNTAGRALSPQEITLAWLKTGWREANNQSTSNIDCAGELDSLLSILNDNSTNVESGMQMRMDNLVDILSYFWIILTKDGNNKNNLLLGNKDYVDGDIMKSIGTTTYKYWNIIKDVVVYCKDKFEDRKLNECFSRSFNAFYVICCWKFITSLSYIQNEGRVRETECKFITQINDSFDKFIDRWYFETLLSDTWSRTDSFATYISQLCILYSKIKSCNDPNQALVMLNELLADLLLNLKQSSINRINSLRAFTRREVIAYKNLLWLWNRLSNDRYAETQKPMRRKSAAPKWEVDHSIPVAIWENKVECVYPYDSSIDKSTGQEISFSIGGIIFTRSSLLSYINLMGNCSLLLRSHNRSKNDEPLGDFFKSIYTDDQIKVIKTVLSIDDCLLHPNNYSINNIIENINFRTDRIKGELIDYLNNGIQREDIV
jgi:uncharacterized protein with ParB-like and HNH nuclease domain